MSRLRQYYANRYTSSEATNAEFANLIRYLNAAELGNQTVGELMEKLFDEDGKLSLGLEFRFNASTGLEFRTEASDQNWQLLAAAGDLRGQSGQNLGTIEAPLFSNRQDATAGVNQTAFPYVASASSNGQYNLMVWVNGVLLAAGAYTYSSATGTLTLSSAPTTNALVSIATIRTSPVNAYRRSDQVAASGQATFPFPFEATEEVVVYRNGILQREGGGFDFVKYQATGVITMTTSQTAGNIITIICITNSAIKDVAGLMLEDKYATNGFIRLDKISMPAESIAQDKVANLVGDLASRAKITVSSTAPLAPGQGDLWVSTAFSVPTLLFYDGIRFLNASPNGLIPLSLPEDALRFLRLNSTSTALEYATFDTSGLVQQAEVGAPNGVAALNSSGQFPSSAIPSHLQQRPIIGRIAGAVPNGTYCIGHIHGNAYSFRGLVGKLTSGSATVQLQIGGVNVGSTLAVNATTGVLAITVTEIDATSAVKDVTLVVSGATSPVDLTYNIQAAITG